MDGTVLTPILGIGTFCTHTLVHARQCIKVNKDLPPEQMSLIGCGVMTGVGAALYSANVQPGQSVAVIGCGGVGDSVIMGARLAGATTIIAVDVDPQQTRMGQGIRRHAYGQPERWRSGRGDQGDYRRVWRQCTHSRRSGKPETLMTALWSRDLAGTCVIIGVAGQEAMVDFPFAKFFDLGGALKVSWYGDCLPTRDFPLLAAWYAQGQLDLDGVVTRVITLEESEEAFHAMERGETLRSVIKL